MVSDTRFVYHRIKAGESFYSVSKQYGLTVDALRNLNGLAKDATLSIGQLLKIKPVQ